LNNELDGVVNLVAPNPVTNAQFAAALGKALRRPAVLPTPTLALKTRFGAEMVEDALLSGQRVLPARLLDAGFEFSATTIDVALERALAD
jgi:NAD dependent epimerase/dehydratase family enzyme